MDKFKPYRPEDDDDDDRSVVWGVLDAFGPLGLLSIFWVTGYVILQYVFVWNRWKVIKSQGWATFITGFLFWAIVALVVILRG